MRTAQQIQADLDAAAKAVVDYYDHPVETPPHATHPAANRDRSQQREWQWETAVKTVRRVLANGGSVRQVAVAAHLPGHLVIAFVEDAQARADAYVAELHHLERQMDAVREMRAKDARARRADGEEKVSLAASFAVTRPTLDKWLNVS